jgi:hypothetical protein
MRHDLTPENNDRFPAPCRKEGCPNVVFEPWEETGALCARCALEGELFDRESRRERAFAA